MNEHPDPRRGGAEASNAPARTMRTRSPALGLVLLLACGGSSPAVSETPSAAREPSTEGDPLAPAGDPLAPEDDVAADDVATEAIATEPDAPAPPWHVSLASNEGAWSMEALDDESVVLLTHMNVRQLGYDPMGTIFAIEVRDRQFALRWRVLSDENVVSVHASADGSRVLVLGVEASHVLSAVDGRELFSLPGYAIEGLVDDQNRSVRAVRTGDANDVEIAGPDGAVITRLPLRGSAPTTVHAMMTDGECVTMYTEDSAHVTSLASAGGLVAIGASDGSIRLHRDGEPPERERSLTRADVRSHPGYAVSPVALSFHGAAELVAVYSDGSIVRWNTRNGSRLGLVRGACTAAELARIAVIEGLPGDVEECGGTMHAAIVGEQVVLAGSSGARVRTLSGRALAGFPTLHGNGIVIRGEEVWLAGTTSVVERWSLDGTFRGVHRLGTGWAHVVALSSDHVAIVGAGEGEVHGEESEGPRPLAIWRLRDGARVRGMDDVRGEVRFVGSRVLASLADASVVVRELSDAREVLRVRAGALPDAGLPGRPVAVVAAGPSALVIGERIHFVDGASVREVGPAPPMPDVGVVTEQHASADGSVLARVIFEPTGFAFSLEVWALGASPALRFRRERVGEHVGLRDDGAQVIVSSRGEEHAHLLDAHDGRELAMPETDASWAGFDARGRACVQSRELDARLSCLVGAAFVTSGPRLLSPSGMGRVGTRTVAFGLGGGAWILDDRGGVLAHVGSVAGDGFAITTPEGLIRASAGAHDELFVRDGRSTRAVTASDTLGEGTWSTIVGR